MLPPAEHVHWMFATGFLLLGLCLLAEAIVGEEVWRRRAWRAYLWPGLLFTMGVLMWPVMVFFTNSTIHMVAHGSWAQVLMLAGGAELGLVRGKLHNPYWRLTLPFALFISGAALLIHEQNGWYFARSAFLHHALGWLLVGGSIVTLVSVLRPRTAVWRAGFALTIVVAALLLYCDRDVAPVFGHLSPLAGEQHR
ncbi:MAG TPA: hypothetical protein VLU96_12500 [Gaiellaceae bacterium]|nr:hypothetical protein [Gaiellaceae bacterium]